MPPRGFKCSPETRAKISAIVRARPRKPFVLPVEWRCIGCKKVKPIADFYLRMDGERLVGVKGRCRQCHYVFTKAIVDRDPERARAYKRAWNRRNRIYWSEYGTKKKYGLSPEEVAHFFNDQAGRCAICQEDLGNKRLHVDHDHDTGVVRGLLCQQCNCGLGQFDDSVDRMRAAIDYLLRHDASRTSA